MSATHVFCAAATAVLASTIPTPLIIFVLAALIGLTLYTLWANK